MSAEVKHYLERFEKETPQDVLTWFLHEYGDSIALASSLGAEDQVLTHMIHSLKPDSKVLSLDTGRLNEETYRVLEQTRQMYPELNYKIYFPNPEDVESFVDIHGPNAFYDSLEMRKECCRIRKLVPLKRALKGLKIWVTGMRSKQSVTRMDAKLIEWDESFGLVKLNPLIKWSDQEVWDYIKTHHVPYNKLHDHGYASIGCTPCTRAIKPGEDIRAGRWWWESPDHKECGLHLKPKTHT